VAEQATDLARFKPAFADVVREVSDSARDPQTMMLIGSLAAVLVDEADEKHWSTFKQALDATDREALRKTLHAQAQQMATSGQSKPVYAARILGVSLIAETHRGDREIAANADLLDGIIDETIRIFRRRAGELAAERRPN
jgi:hypothetical protein